MLIAVGDIALINNDGAPQLIYFCPRATCAYEIAGSAMYTHGRAVAGHSSCSFFNHL